MKVQDSVGLRARQPTGMMRRDDDKLRKNEDSPKYGVVVMVIKGRRSSKILNWDPICKVLISNPLSPKAPELTMEIKFEAELG